MKNKTLLISCSFFETTFPLVKSLSEKVDVALLALVSDKMKTPPGFDVSNLDLEKNKIINYNQENCPHYSNLYFKGVNIERKIALFGGSFIEIAKLFIQIQNYISTVNPDIIHFIGHHPLIYILSIFNSNKQVITLHEVDTSRLGNTKLRSLLKYYIARAFRKNSQIIVHSNNALQKFSKLYNYINVNVVPFGLFEVYKLAGNAHIPFSKENFVLFFGYIKDYKGADIFVESIKILSNRENIDIEYVIAGRGAGNLNVDKSWDVKVLDKFLTDEELVDLLKKCSFIVAPHKSASQSGIPNTCYVFNKPIIGSNIDGLKDVIIPDKTGLLCEVNNPEDLAKQIIKLQTDKVLYDDMCSYLKTDKNDVIKTWNEIALETCAVYDKLLAKH